MTDDATDLEPAAFLGTFVTCRQVRDEVHFIVAVPAEKGTECLARIGGFPKPGESRWVAIARAQSVTNQSELVKQANSYSNSHNAYSRRAGMLSADRLFWRYIEAPGEDPATFAASYIRNQCKVRSRRDILPGTEAAATFDSLELAFKLWAHAPRHVEQN